MNNQDLRACRSRADVAVQGALAVGVALLLWGLGRLFWRKSIR